MRPTSMFIAMAASAACSTSASRTTDAPGSDFDAMPSDGSVEPLDPPTDCAATTCRYITPNGAGTRDGSDWANALAGIPLNGNGYSTTLVRGATYFLASGAYSRSIVFAEPPSGQLAITLKKALDPVRCAQLGKRSGDCRGTDVGWSDALGEGESVFEGQLTFARDHYRVDGQVRNERKWDQPGSYGFRVKGGIVSSDAANGPNDYGRRLRFTYLDIGGPYGDAFAGTRSDGIRLTSHAGAPITDVFVSRCYFHNLGVAVFGANTDGVTIEHSYVGPAWAKEALIGHLPSQRWTVRNNRFVDTCQGVPGEVGAEACTAYIASWANGTNSTTESDDWKIYGNVFVRTSRGRPIGQSDGSILGGSYDGPSQPTSKARNWKVYNNVFADLTGAANGNYTLSLHGTGHVAVNNIYWNLGNVSLGCSSDAGCATNWCAQSSCGSLDLVGGSEDPFVNATGFDFRLKSAATPRNAGVEPAGVTDRSDPNGIARGGDGRWDVGAFESP